MPETIARDIRVDRIGFVAELQKKLADKLKSEVKLRMTSDSLERVQGDFFDGLLTTSTSSTIDPAKFLRLYEAGKITRPQLLSAMRVVNDPALEFLSREDVAKISSTSAPILTLRVTRRKGYEPSLEESLRALNEAVTSQ